MGMRSMLFMVFIMIELGIILEKGWKAEENKRFGDVLVITFTDTELKEVIFKYAPKLSEVCFWIDTVSLLQNYDQALKHLRNIAEQIENLNKSTFSLYSPPCKP